MSRKSAVLGKVLKLVESYHKEGMKPELKVIAKRVGRDPSSVFRLLTKHCPDWNKEAKPTRREPVWNEIGHPLRHVFDQIVESIGEDKTTGQISQETGMPLRSVQRWFYEGVIHPKNIAILLNHCGLSVITIAKASGIASSEKLTRRIKELELENIELKAKLGVTFTQDDEYRPPTLAGARKD